MGARTYVKRFVFVAHPIIKVNKDKTTSFQGIASGHTLDDHHDDMIQKALSKNVGELFMAMSKNTKPCIPAENVCMQNSFKINENATLTLAAYNKIKKDLNEKIQGKKKFDMNNAELLTLGKEVRLLRFLNKTHVLVQHGNKLRELPLKDLEQNWDVSKTSFKNGNDKDEKSKPIV